MESKQATKAKQGSKSLQGVVAVGVAAALVFGGTFLVNYIHVGKSAPRAAPPQARLTFADLETNFPPQSQPMPDEEELGTPKFHDFWFKNDNPTALPVGVFSKTCQCTHVELWLAPAEWKDVPAPEEREKAVKELESLTHPTELMDRDDNPPSVPAGAVGVLRLTWKGDRAGPKDLAAVLWMGEKGLGPQQRFLIRTVFLNPMQSVAAFDFGNQPQEKLPITANIPCWSSTRTEFPLEADVLQNRLTKQSNPFTVGKPVPFTKEEIARMGKDPKSGTVLSGYWVPIRLLKVSQDGTTPFDLGLFRQRIKLRMDEDHEVQVVVNGSIEGDLRVVSSEAANGVHFPSFDRTTEASQPIIVESEADVASLTFDRNRTPPFLGVDFPAAPEKSGDRKLWMLIIKWKPESEAVGVFPRDEEGYRDSAVYIKPVYSKTTSQAPSALRIPVNGKADAPQ